MAGLLYKDFVAVNKIGKYNVAWLYCIITIAFIVLRIIFNGNSSYLDLMIMNEKGETIDVNGIDIVFVNLFFLQLLAIPSLVLNVGKVIGNDEKNKIRGYLVSLPIDKKAYVVSKYIFFAISFYVFASLDFIWGITCAAFCKAGIIQDLVSMANSFIVPGMSVVIFVMSIEIPLCLILGRETEMRVMVAFWTVIALIVVGFLMFGDLTIFEKIDIYAVMVFFDKYKTEVLIFQSLAPVIALALYYASYRLSVFLYSKKEGEN